MSFTSASTQNKNTELLQQRNNEANYTNEKEIPTFKH